MYEPHARVDLAIVEPWAPDARRESLIVKGSSIRTSSVNAIAVQVIRVWKSQ